MAYSSRLLHIGKQRYITLGIFGKEEVVGETSRLSALKKTHKQAVFEETACYFFA